MKKELRELAVEVTDLLREILASNGLRDSRIYDELSISGNDTLASIIVKEYIIYINQGLKAGINVPISALAEWAARKGIPTDNSTLFAIQRSIYNHGIKARPVLDDFYADLDDTLNEFSEQLYESLVNEINI